MVVPELAVRFGIFSLAQAREAGLPDREIRRNLRTGAWVKPDRSRIEVVGRQTAPLDPVVRALLACGSPLATVSHTTAAGLRRWDRAEGDARRHVTVPLGCSGRTLRGVRIHRATLTGDDREVAHGFLPVTSAVRTALDVAATLPFAEAVVCVDSALRSRDVSVDDLLAGLGGRAFWPTHARTLAVLRAADPRSASVPESQARLLFVAAGLGGVPQLEVRAGGEFIARVDFGWPWCKVAVEIDGFAWHSSQRQLQEDHARQNRLELAGWLVLRYTVEDIRDRPDLVVAQIRAGLAA